MKKVPSFFTFFEAETDNVNMQIPIAFTRRMGKPFPEKVFLRDRHNNLWTVKMEKIGDYWYFVDGWDTFANENSFTSRDLLVFSYISQNLFNFKVYGQCATEKNLTRPSMVREDDGDDDEYDFDEITETENGDHLSIDSDNEDALTNVNNDGVASNQGLEMAPYYPKCYGMEIFEAGLAEKPTNPYFVAKLMPKRKSNLFIPRDVIYDYKVRIGHEITLVDPSGREFESECKQWSDGRFVVAKGWASLCRVNSVSQNDKCICEFVQREADERQFLYINILRSNIL